METPTDLFIPGPVGRLAVRAKGMNARSQQAIVMVQGSNLTGQAMFDFSWSEGYRYSLMNELIESGFAAITFSVRGYGASDSPADPFTVTTDAAMEDLDAVIHWVDQQGYKRPHLLGFSWGGRIVGRYVEQIPDKIGRLILYNPARGGGDPILPAPTDPWWSNTAQFYVDKLEPEFTDPELYTALAIYIEANEPRSPNGIRLENAAHVQEVVPERITQPTLLIYGAEAAKAPYMQGGISRSDFFEQLATEEKVFTVLPNGGDFAHFQTSRFRLYAEIHDFLSPN